MEANIAQVVPDIDSFPDNSIYTHKKIPLDYIIDLRSKGLSYSQIAKVVGCTKNNISLRLQGIEAEESEVSEFKNHRADLFAKLQMQFMNSLTSADIKKMPGGSRVLAIAQLYDKERLERGLSTSNIDSHATEVHINQLSSELDKIRSRRLQLQGKKENV